MARQYKSLPNLNAPVNAFISTLSEPNLNAKEEPILSYTDMLCAAQLLTRIVHESGGTSTRLRKNTSETFVDSMTHAILNLVYETMKFLPVIDTILIKTQFLVYFPEELPLVKLVIYELMNHNFDHNSHPGFTSSNSEADNAEINELKSLITALATFRVKMAASFARVRIEKQAHGNNAREMLQNIIPSTSSAIKEKSGSVFKHVRIAESQVAFIAAELQRLGVSDDSYSFDVQFLGCLSISQETLEDIKESNLFKNNLSLLQDRSQFYLVDAVSCLIDNEVKGPTEIICTRGGNGSLIMNILERAAGVTRVHAYDERVNRSDALRLKMNECSSTKECVSVYSKDFLSVKPTDADVARVTTIICTPPHSGSAIVNKLNHFMQEKGKLFRLLFDDEISSTNAQRRKRRLHSSSRTLFNCATPSHVLIFIVKDLSLVPSVNTVLFSTNSLHREENEDVVEDLMQTLIGDEWYLECVLPEESSSNDLSSIGTHTSLASYLSEECFNLKATANNNGIFIVCFKRIPVMIDEEIDEEEPVEAFESITTHTGSETTLVSVKQRKVRTKLPAGQEQDSEPKIKGKTLRKLVNIQRAMSRMLSRPRKIHTEESMIEVEKARKEVNASKTSLASTVYKSEMEGGGVGVLGTGLMRFYAPRHEAELRIKTAQHWKYPVPNPTPFK